MFSSSTMVKFFTQTCPKTLGSNTLEPSKCLSIVKGQMVPTRGLAQKDGGMYPDSKDRSGMSKEEQERKKMEEEEEEREKDKQAAQDVLKKDE